MRAARREDGMTLVEILIAMVIALVVGSAVLEVFEKFDRGADANERLTDAQDNARRAMGTMVRVLRNAGAAPSATSQPATVLRAQPDDVLVRTTDWPGASRHGSGVHLVRYCLSAARDTVYFQGLRAGTAGPQDPGTACPGAAAGWETKVAVQRVANAAAEPVFVYGTTAGQIRTVGIDLAIQAGTRHRARPTHLRSAATLRGAVLPEVDADDITPQCQPDGRSLLSLGVAVDGDGNPLRLGSETGIPVGDRELLVTAGSTVQVVVSNVLGLQKLLLKEVPPCP